MATTKIRSSSEQELDALIDEWITPDPYKFGRHNTVIRGSRTHLWAILGYLDVNDGDIAQTAKAYYLPETAIRAAIGYRNRHKELFDADRLLREEEDNS